LPQDREKERRDAGAAAAATATATTAEICTAATTAATAADSAAAAAGAAATATINRRFDCGRGPGQRYDFAICQGGGATAVAQCPALSHVHGGAGALRPESGHLAESLPAPDAFAVPQRNDNCPAE